MSQMFGRRNGVDEELLEAKSPGAARRPAEAPKTTSPKASSSNAGSSNGAAATENVGAGPRPGIARGLDVGTRPGTDGLGRRSAVGRAGNPGAGLGGRRLRRPGRASRRPPRLGL